MASPELLKATLMVAGRLDAQSAEAMAGAIVEIRSHRDSRGVPQGLEAVEDLLAVPGMEYGLYARLRDSVTTDIRGSGRVNPLSASMDVLSILAQGDVTKAQQVLIARDSGAIGVDTSMLNAGFIDMAAIHRIKLKAVVAMPQGSYVATYRYVDLNAGARDGLPWRVFREANTVEPGSSPRT
jgi:general secretion pathway protein K